MIGSVAGGLLGSAIPFNTTGIEFSMTALFVVIFVEQWEKTKQHLPAITGLVISVLCLLLFGASDFLIPSMIDIRRSLLIIAVVAVVTMAIRFLPFILFRSRTPEAVLYLGQVLPYAIMAMLVVYCLKGVSLINSPYGIPEAAAVLLVALLHKWKHNTLLSILAGTVAYMLMIQLVF